MARVFTENRFFLLVSVPIFTQCSATRTVGKKTFPILFTEPPLNAQTNH